MPESMYKWISIEIYVPHVPEYVLQIIKCIDLLFQFVFVTFSWLWGTNFKVKTAVHHLLNGWCPPIQRTTSWGIKAFSAFSQQSYHRNHHSASSCIGYNLQSKTSQNSQPFSWRTFRDRASEAVFRTICDGPCFRRAMFDGTAFRDWPSRDGLLYSFICSDIYLSKWPHGGTTER